MSRIPEKTIDILNNIPLTLVMEHNGYTIAHCTENAAYYHCPFHNEKDASFKVDTHTRSSSLPGFYCFGCGMKGFGAIMLQAALTQRRLGKDFREIVSELSELCDLTESDDTVDALAKLGNAVINDDHKNGFFHRAKVVAPSDEFTFVAKESFSHSELRALGCQVQQVFRKNWYKDGQMDAVMDGDAPLWKYSFGECFYSADRVGEVFNPSRISERFSVYPISEFTTEKRWKEDKNAFESHRVVSTDTYPIFVFKYQDEKGWWCRKYEPYFKSTEGSKRNYKFTWWYQGAKRRDEEISSYMYGDVDVMRALSTGTVETTDDSHPTTDVVVREGGNRITTKKFSRLIICSGPRDAINVYFHSDAHVCFPHSETVDISPSTIKKLYDIAQEVFILYDSDETGRKRANSLAMRFLELKVIYLPRALSQIESPRTGRPCKDAEEYFNYFSPVLKKIRNFHGDINEHFAAMVQDAKPMMFWKQRNMVRNKNKEDEYIEPKFTLRINNMNQFLSASGMCKYDMGSEDTYANIGEDKIVDIMREKRAFVHAKSILKEYLANNRKYNNEDLSDTISDTRKLSLSTLQEISELHLDFKSWGEKFDYLFFSNGAVKVTKDGMTCTPYERMPFHTNREAILENASFKPVKMEDYFEIVYNKDIAKMESEYAVYRKEANTAEEKKRVQEEFNAYKRLWQFKLVFKKPMNEMPAIIQFIYDMGRIFWREEENGFQLSPEKRQFQDMHFINKIVGLGYMLSRYRTDRRQQMVTITDYHQQSSSQASGRSGKTILMHLLGLVRKGLENVPGKQFNTDPTRFAQNFSGFTQTVHSFVSIDDLRTDLKDDTFYNLVCQLPVKNLYRDPFRIPLEESPKVIVTTNQSLNVTSTSTYGRMWPMYACDYYHGDTYGGESQLRSPETKFGYDIVKGKDDEECNFNRNLLAYSLQCYFQYLETGEKGVIHPPIDNEAKIQTLANSCKLTTFVDWFTSYFSSENPWHFERPIDIVEMTISYIEQRDALKERRDPITKSAIEALIPSMKTEIRRFCDAVGILVNPNVIYTGEHDRERGMLRRTTWMTQFDENGRIREPRVRVRTSSRRCFYFYRKGDEPKTNEQVLDAPMRDMEFEED